MTLLWHVSPPSHCDTLSFPQIFITSSHHLSVHSSNLTIVKDRAFSHSAQRKLTQAHARTCHLHTGGPELNPRPLRCEADAPTCRRQHRPQYYYHLHSIILVWKSGFHLENLDILTKHILILMKRGTYYICCHEGRGHLPLNSV